MTNQDGAGSSASGNRVFLTGRDELLDEALKFLCAAKRRANITVADELPGQVRQQRAALIAGKAKFTAVNKVSHDRSLEIVLIIVQQVNRGAITSLRRLELEAMLLQLIANFDQRLLSKATDAGEVRFARRGESA